MQLLRTLAILFTLTMLVMAVALIEPVYALTVTADGITVTVTYTEPTTNKNATALTDLDHCNVYYNIGAGDVKTANVPASAMTGGAQKSSQFTVPVAPDAEVDAGFNATCSDTTGNESDHSQAVQKRLDSLPPGIPQ